MATHAAAGSFSFGGGGGWPRRAGQGWPVVSVGSEHAGRDRVREVPYVLAGSGAS
jgi:hypothetical protein